ncbi:hypothetical protein [Duganella rivi]|nr:hypothetical protein [Duganella rivi]
MAELSHRRDDVLSPNAARHNSGGAYSLQIKGLPALAPSLRKK